MTAVAILLAAGRSTRMGGADKMLADLGGLPVAAHSLRAFAACTAIDAIVIVATPGGSDADNSTALVELAKAHGQGKVRAITPGGARRRDSVAHGIAALSDSMLSPEDLVVVHDAARPLTTPAMIERGLALAVTHGAAIATATVVDTIKTVAPDSSGDALSDAALVQRTIDRTALRSAQTPQAFQFALLQRAHAAAPDTFDATDDATLVEALGAPVMTYDAGSPNLKITTTDDLTIAAALMAARSVTTPAAPASGRR